MNRLKAYKKNNKVTSGNESELWNSYLNSPTQDVHEKLVAIHLPLVFKQVERLSIRVRQQVEKDELVGAGVVGLHNAISKFKPGKDASFSTFASFRIKGALIDELRKQDHLTRNQRTFYKKICETIHNLNNTLKRCPTLQEVAAEHGVSEAVVSRTIGMASNALSLDNTNAQGLSYSEVIEDEKNKQPWETADDSLTREHMREAFKNLPQRDQQLLYLRYFKEMRVKEIALAMDISEGRVSQLYKEALVKLRSIMKIYN